MKFIFCLCLLGAVLGGERAGAAHPAIDDRYRIMGYVHVNRRRFADYLLQKNPRLQPSHVRKLVRIYDEECHMEDVRMAVAFAQMCHETGFLKFNGKVLPSQNNFCGHGAEGASKGNSFRTMREGVRIHVQHLKAYGSAEPLRNRNIDSRRLIFAEKFGLGTKKTVFDLNNSWDVTNPQYGAAIAAIIDDLMVQ